MMRLSIKTKLIVLFLAIMCFSLILVSWKGLDYFRSDKETYVQALNVQNVLVLSNFLADRIDALKKVVATFSEFVDYRFADERAREKAQKDLLLKFRDFLSISVFKIQPLKISEVFSVYDTARLKLAMVDRKDLGNHDLLLKMYNDQGIGRIELRNMTKQSNFPLVLLSLKKPNGVFVLASVPQKTLMNIIGKKEVYTAFVVDGKGNLILHQSSRNLVLGKNIASHPLVHEFLSDKEKRLSGASEYFDPTYSEEMLGAWGHVGDTDLGLIVQMPKRLAYLAAKELIRKLAIWIGLIAFVAVMFTLVFSSTIIKPLKELAKFAVKVGEGDFSADVPKKTNDEVGELVEAFNRMNIGLKERDAKIEETHKQLVQSEKMGAFGQMSAGIAHEVKNPLAGILGYAQIAKKKAPPEAGITNYLEIIEKETKRCKDIIENLMRFARQEKAVFSDINITKVVADSVALIDHQITISGIKIERKFSPDAEGPIVFGNTNQITQVLTNIMLNAQYAMKKKGEGGVLTVEVPSPQDGKVTINVSDTGIGMAKENLTKIFEPFFTTKPSGEGTGLGLSVTYGIVKDHKGEIYAESEEGKWARFTIILPIKNI